MLLPITPASVLADRCDDALPGEARRRVESPGHVLVFRPVPAQITVGGLFSIEAQVCRRGSGPAAQRLRVDATMPEHRHGMNDRASVSAQGDGRFVADGLLFHMPGRWQLVFDVEAGAGTERLVADIVLE